MVQLPEAITLENEASRCKGKWPLSAVTAAIFVSVSLLSCFGRDHGNGGPASRYDDQDGEFPEAAWTQERFDWRWQSCDPRKGKFSLYALEVEPERTCVLSHFSRVQLFATPWTTAHQAPLSLGFSRQEYWSGLPFPSPILHPLDRLQLKTEENVELLSTDNFLPLWKQFGHFFMD